MHAATPLAGEVEAGVDGQAMQPGFETVRVSQPGQVAPGSDEGILDRVARELAVSEDQSSSCVQPREGSASDRGEGVMIAPSRSLDETTLVHGRLSIRRGTPGRARMLWRRDGGNRSRTRTEARNQPSEPSISSFTRRLNSMAYSIGSSLVKTSRKP